MGKKTEELDNEWMFRFVRNHPRQCAGIVRPDVGVPLLPRRGVWWAASEGQSRDCDERGDELVHIDSVRITDC